MDLELSQQIEHADQLIHKAKKISLQGAYKRRAPSCESIILFNQARELLDRCLSVDPANIVVLILYSQVEEYLLHYSKAIAYLNRAVSSGYTLTKKDLKRLFNLRESLVFWRDLGLEPRQLHDLGTYLEKHNVGPQHDTLTLTTDWLLIHRVSDQDAVISAIKRNGAYSDFQVLQNLVRG